MKYIEVTGLVQGSDEWRRWRATGIGGSDAPLIGMPAEENLYGKTVLSLWREKMGYAEAQFDATAQAHMKRGHELEPKAREEFIKRTGIWIEPVCMQSATHPFMLASLDGINASRDVGAEIKAPAEKMFRLMLEKGTPWYYKDQIQHQLFVTGAREFYFWAYNEDVEPHVFIERHEPDHGRIQELIRKESAFWRHVELNIAPSTELGISRSQSGLIGLTEFAGYARAGKDTLGLKHYNVFKTSRFGFADPLKDIYCEMNGLIRADLDLNKEKHRPRLVALGHGMRSVDPDVWVNGVFNGRTGIYESMVKNGAIITDTRYVNEVSVGRKHADRLGVPFRLVWVERPGVGPANEMERDFTSLLCSMSDVIIINNADLNDPINSIALEMALVHGMSVIPEGKSIQLAASDYREAASKEVKSEPKRNQKRVQSNKSRKG